MTVQVHTLRFGDAPWLKACAPTLENWCNRHGNELVVWDDPATWAAYPSPKFVEVDALRRFLRGSADVFAWVDADVYVNAHAPACPEFGGIAMATCPIHASHQTEWETWCLENFMEVPSYFQYSNAGVYFIDREAAEILVKQMEPPFIEAFQEQHQMNYWVWKANEAGASFNRLPDTWNRHGKRFEASWFTHLWGNTKEEDLDTLRTMKLLDVKPDGLVRGYWPPTWPSSDKVIILEFVQDAGLGNTLFEISAAYSIARTLNLPMRWVWRPSKLREFDLKHFGFAENPYIEYPMLMMKAGQGSRALRDKAIKLIAESKERFCGISCPFQDEKCFIDHADEIREMFKPMVTGFPLPNPEGTTPVGVQVRRGDYVKHPRLNVTTPEYFLGAMQWMRRHIKNPHFIIVSDDPHYCHKIFEKELDATVMPTQSSIEGLRTLASCKAHIISNSTFGWWGAWLGETGPVVTPEHWHHMPGSYGNWNPVPDRWIKLPIGQDVKTAPVKVITPRVVVPLPEPELERAIVYPWHADQARWQELRFSLRSIEKHFADKKCPIFIFGTRRPGFISESDPRVQYRGAYTYSEALANGVQIAKKVMWMNDDTILLKPATWEDCSIPYYLRKVGPDFLKHGQSNNNPWREGCLRVLRQLKEMGIEDQKVFSTHLPYVWEREKALQVFEKFGIWEKMPMEIAYFHLFPEGAKKLTNERTENPSNLEASFLNYADRHLDEAFKSAVMRLFPDAAPWEVNGGKF